MMHVEFQKGRQEFSTPPLIPKLTSQKFTHLCPLNETCFYWPAYT